MKGGEGKWGLGQEAEGVRSASAGHQDPQRWFDLGIAEGLQARSRG